MTRFALTPTWLPTDTLTAILFALTILPLLMLELTVQAGRRRTIRARRAVRR